MDSEYIERLLERYWQCETSLKEEAELRVFFSQGDVPSHLRRYKELFVYQEAQQDVCLGDDFDRKVLAQIEMPVVKARQVTLWSRFMPLCKAAAVVAIMLSVGTVLQHTIFADSDAVIMPDTIGKQITTPSVAFSDECDEEQEQQLIDSLRQISPKKKSLR